MNILALEPYYGGSHKAFIDGLSQPSRHTWTVLTLPARKWKWRMRHSAITFAQQTARLLETTKPPDLLFCSDMLNLAEYTALAPDEISRLPKVIYFHENQLTYPVRFEHERDYQFALTNLTSALAADAVWFNSHFHMNSFLRALLKFLRSMPDFQPLYAPETIRAKSSVHYPGITELKRPAKREPGPLRILWAARWEHDKNPESFFTALEILKRNNVRFRLSVIGQSFRDRPDVFDSARKSLSDKIDHWGYQKTRADYENVLKRADVVVSTANHEFFGIGIVEAVAAGACPLVPNRLSYPEIIGLERTDSAHQFFYDGSPARLADKLCDLAARIDKGPLFSDQVGPASLTDRFKWRNLTPAYDEALEQIAPDHRSRM
jgi:glycosyltransferase involved in cell wall biosynthesis